MLVNGKHWRLDMTSGISSHIQSLNIREIEEGKEASITKNLQKKIQKFLVEISLFFLLSCNKLLK